MSRENVELIELARRAYTAYAEHGSEGMLAFVDEQVEIDEAPEFPDTGTFRGHDGIQERLAGFTDTFDDFRMELEDAVEGSEDRVVAILKVTGTAKASRIPVEIRAFHVHTVRNGKSVRVQIFLNPDAAFEAAGLSE